MTVEREREREREKNHPASSAISCDSKILAFFLRIPYYKLLLVKSTKYLPCSIGCWGPCHRCPRQAAGNKQEQGRDGRGGRASELRGFAAALPRLRALLRTRFRRKRARAKSDCSPDSSTWKNIKTLVQPRWMDDMACSHSSIAVELILLQSVVAIKWDVRAYVAGHHWSNPVT
jgi:hypothetical protein